MSWGTSLAVQWLRICLPVQGMWVQSLVGELRSHIHGAGKPVCCNYWACKPQLEKLMCHNKDLVLPKTHKKVCLGLGCRVRYFWREGRKVNPHTGGGGVRGFTRKEFTRKSLFLFYGWILFHHMDRPHFIYPFIHQWTFGLFSLSGYCESSCCEQLHTGFHVDVRFPFSWVEFLEVELLGHISNTFFFP